MGLAVEGGTGTSARIVVTLNAAVVEEFELRKQRTTIGRAPDNDIRVVNPAVSAHHAAITTVRSASVLEDLGSRNGTYVNGQRVEKHALRNGDVVRIVRHELKYVKGKPRVEEHGSKGRFARLKKIAPVNPPRPTPEAADAAQEETRLSLLDELKLEARDVETREQEKQRAKEQQKEAVRERLAPHMRALYRYLTNLAGELTRVNPEVVTTYTVEGYGALPDLRQHGYKVFAEDPETIDHFTFSCVREGEGVHEFRKELREEITRQREYLWSHNLRFGFKVGTDGVGVFTLQPWVPVAFDFSSDLDQGRIRLGVRNAIYLGKTTYTYDPGAINAGFMDELARYIVRRPNRFDELSGNVISEEVRKQLQQQLASRGENDGILT